LKEYSYIEGYETFCQDFPISPLYCEYHEDVFSIILGS